MPDVRRNKRFWVIRWEGDQLQKQFLHLLPVRQSSTPIEEYMIGLYFNSPSLLLFERRKRINATLRKNIKILRERSRITVGSNPFLVAWEVDDLVIAHKSAEGVEHVSYTEPPEYRVNSKTKAAEPIGSPRQVHLEIKAGAISG
jgi:hypothetical protein